MGEIINFILANLLWIVLAVAGFLAYRWWRSRSTNAPTGQTGGQQIISSQDAIAGVVTAVAIVAVVVVVAVSVIAVIRPQVFAFIFSSVGPVGPDRQIQQSKADLISFALDPADDPSVWRSAPAQAAADALASEYQLATAKNKAGMSAAAAEAACYLPKGVLERALWDNAGMDPCESSIPAGVQASTRAVAKTTGEVVQNAGKIDLSPLDRELSKPLGQAPYDMPKGVFIIVGLLIAIFVLGSTLRTLARSPAS